MQEAAPLTVDIRSDGPLSIASVWGDVDISNSVELALRLEAAARQAGDEGLTVDLSDLHYLDSSGLRSLLKVHNAHPSMHLVVRSGTLVARVIDVSGLKDVLNVERVPAHAEAPHE